MSIRWPWLLASLCAHAALAQIAPTECSKGWEREPRTQSFDYALDIQPIWGQFCANCHVDNYGKYIRADLLSQGNINGFPTYRLKWQGVGSLHRRFKGCMDQVRAKPYKRGSDEFVALEAYLASRGAGLSVETPAVRN